MDQSFRLADSSPASMVFPELEPVETKVVREDVLKPARRSRFLAERKVKPGTRHSLGNIHATAMGFRDIHEHGTLLVKYLEARKSIFIDRLNWTVSEADGMEFDQYDTPACRWVVLHEFGEVLGGVRLLPTTARCGTYSYMLRDAQNGLLEGLPRDVLFFEAPVKPFVWEASRFFITETVPSTRRTDVQQKLFDSMARTAVQNGASKILGIVPSVWSRWARRLGAGATPIGAKFSIDGTMSQSVLFNIRDYLI
ncbi:acyl-homoserine-lactone synthase [Ruegeria marina]|uniref:N-acyl-L-homoserine lactone synthetase n=1 Tax=Ruegeria marina TaxID=639004 RepID=A0A1G7E2M1_9RHOB|nr:acyl-homoserine-lactone synthase [Ruegeria marina]SDE57625.1 N-acyl-L-homoserine lactone synthetase [Ruegeria marina]